MNRRPGSRPHGQIRQSQLLTSFGPGSMLDLPNHSVLVGGLDTWSTGGDEIIEPRLVDKLKQLFEPPLQVLKLYSPPPDLDDPTAPQTGITAWQFPEWFITQDVDADASHGVVRARMLVHRRMLTKGKFIDDTKKKRTVVPVRFVRACRSGHIGDIDWYKFVHGGETNCRRQLWIEERGTTGDLSEVWVRCDCGKGERNMLQASEQQTRALGNCDGNRPWLGPYSKEKCGEPNRLLIRTASNAYFSQLMSVISLPDRNENVREAVETVWDFIGEVEDLGELKYERKKAKVHAVLDGFTDEEVFAEDPGPPRTVAATIQVDQAGGNGDAESPPRTNSATTALTAISIARTLPKEVWDAPWMKNIERVVLVHRLREVIAQVGFTRFEAISPDIDGELEMGVRRASLTREIRPGCPPWRIAAREFSSSSKRKPSKTGWQERMSSSRAKALERGHRIWAEEHKNLKAGLSRPAVYPDALSIASAGHGGFPGMRLSREFDPRTNLRHPRCRVRHLAVHRDFRRRGHARRAGAGRPTTSMSISAMRWSWANCVPTIRSVPNTIPPTRMSGGFYTGPPVTDAC